MQVSTAESLQCYSYQAIHKGSLSFSFASRMFGRVTRDRVVRLYAWCRFLDDETDGEKARGNLGEALRTLRRLEYLSFDAADVSQAPSAIQAFRSLREEVSLPDQYARELINGMDMDLAEQRYEELEDLQLYCYRVAGVVGLMMSHVMGVSSEKAYQHAVDLGNAMQLTNICRDIREDVGMGRVYLPLTWLRARGINDPDQLMQAEYRLALVSIVSEILDQADQSYRSGDEGLKYLSFRCALAVAIAREVYAAIGHELRRRGVHAWDQRVWIPLPSKLRLAFKGLVRVLGTVPYRIQYFLKRLC